MNFYVSLSDRIRFESLLLVVPMGARDVQLLFREPESKTEDGSVGEG